MAPEANWNIAELLERVEGDHEFLRELLSVFRQDSQSNLVKAKAQLVEHDLPGVSRTAHTLKGMLRNLSMERAAGAARQLEAAAQEGKHAQGVAFLEELERGLEEVQPQVDAQLTEVQT